MIARFIEEMKYFHLLYWLLSLNKDFFFIWEIPGTFMS